MKLAIISDIHGNLEAFNRVLDDLYDANVDACLSLGDNVGYGPEPEQVVDLIKKENIPSVLGNHELAIVQPEFLSWFNALAQKTIMLTAGLLSPEAIDYCRQIPKTMERHKALFVHGCPPDSVLFYIFEQDDLELKRIFWSMSQNICFVGHTHLLEIIEYDGKKIHKNPIGQTQMYLEPTHQYIINVGSVGQPRDPFSKDAKYVIWDPGANLLEVRFVPYNAKVTADKILALGWPEFLARRLL